MKVINSSIKIITCILFLSITLNLKSQDQQEKESGVKLIENVLNNHGIDSAQSHFNLLKSDTTQYYFNDNEFINFCYKLLNSEREYEALRILEMAQEISPSSPNILIFLATAYFQNNNFEKSIATFKSRSDILAEFQLKKFIEDNKGALLNIADEVIKKNIEATGGEDAWRKIKTMTVTFSMQPDNGDHTEIVRLYKRPNLYRQGVKGSKSFNSTDGVNTWNFNGKEWKESNTKYRTTSIDDYTLDYKEIGIYYEFIGLEVLNHNPVYHLARTFPNGYKQDLNFSAKTFLLQEIKSDYFESYPFMESYFSLWNYKDVFGVKIPHVFIRNVGSMGPPHGGIITDIQVNVPLSDSLFLPPEHR
ncbi:tetratricopeptide repeat protein [Bacteroidota bacterium]